MAIFAKSCPARFTIGFLLRLLFAVNNDCYISSAPRSKPIAQSLLEVKWSHDPVPQLRWCVNKCFYENLGVLMPLPYLIFRSGTILGVMELQLQTNQLLIFTASFTLDSVTFGLQQKAKIRKRKRKQTLQRYLGGEVLFGGEGLSESTESMLDQVIQLTWVGGREKVGTSSVFKIHQQVFGVVKSSSKRPF